jgi:hypothetical protein
MLGLLLVCVDEAAKNFFLGARELLPVWEGEQCGQIERYRDELAGAWRSPRVIDEAYALFTPDLTRDAHLLLLVEFEDCQQLAVKRHVRNFRASRGNKGRSG